ncbi:MAG: 30S ribosomal protein S1 [Bacteroidota bacterium]|nr:30S ribosomal protein S1 [Bacteroidota bacterium]
MAKKKIEKTEEESSVEKKEKDTVKTSKDSKSKKPTKKKGSKVSDKPTKSKKEDSVDLKDSSVKEEKKVSPEKFLKEFDWHNFEEGIEKVDEKKLEDFDKLVKENFVETLTNKVVEGTVVHISDRDAIIDINAKSEGVISLNEFRYNPNLSVGDKVEVLIDIREDASGQLILSHRKARVINAWDRVNSAHDSGEIVNGFVKCRTKGGMIVDVFGIEAFLPGSQIDVKPIRDYDQFVNKTMEFKVVKINHEFKNVVVSHKALIEADIELQKKEIIKQLEKGQILEGSVKNITTYGVFMDLGGVDGLIHITDLSWSRINHPNEIVELDQKLKVVILDFDEDKSRIQLGLKQLSKHPWEALGDDIKIGDVVKGKVVVIADYGAFIEIAEGVEGLIHVSEMSWSTHLRSAQDFVNVGDKIEAKILTFDREERKMSLGVKQLTPDPWTDITKKYPVGSKHTGMVRNFTNFGVFVELEEGVDGLIYISDLSWTKKIKHPRDFCNANENIEVVVLELDVDNRKLSLGHKQLTENPWDKYEKEFELNSIHKSEISEMVPKGAIVKFNEDVTGFVPSRHLVKEDGSKLEPNEQADFKVIEFNKDSKRIVLSHTQTFEKKEDDSSKPKNKKKAKPNIEEESKNTIGDANEQLQELKDKMDGK